MENQFVITTTAHWKALSHPLRASIIRLLTERSLTNEELADSLGVESGKLYFHTKNLLDAGLIEISETRSKGPITEKVYSAIARSFVANELPDAENVDTDAPPFDYLISSMQTLYRQSWRDTDPVADRGHYHYAYHIAHRIPPERLKEFVARMKALTEEFQEMRTDDSEALEYAFGVLLHSVPPSTPRKK